MYTIGPMGPNNPALLAHPSQPAVFVFDRELLLGKSPTTADPQYTAPEAVTVEDAVSAPVTPRMNS